MHSRTRNPFISTIVALGVMCTLVVFVRAQTPPAPPSAPAASEPTTEPQVASEADVEQSTPAQEPELRRLDTPTAPAPESDMSAVAVDPKPEGVVTAEAEDTESETAATETKTAPPAGKRRRHAPSDEVPFGNHRVHAGDRVSEMVSLVGDSVLDGESRGEVVSIFGNTTVNGTAGGEAVAVLGNVVVNGEVKSEVVAVLGNVTLGPKAIVHGDIVTVGGQLQRDPGAVVHGNVQVINFLGHGADFDWARTWLRHCALLGRPLAFHAGLGWAWLLAGGVFAFYVLLALLFPRAFEKCAETLEQRPGYSLLAVVLTVLITPVLIILLIATGVGIILVPFVVAGIFFASLFGKAVMHAWLGRRITKYFGAGPMTHVATATLLGSVLLLLLYTVPFLGFFLWKVLDVIGLGVVVYALILSMRREKPPVPPVMSATTTGMAVATAGLPPPVGGEVGAGFAPTGAATVAPPPLPVTSLPRAGFWIRIAASLLDAIIVGVVAGLIHMGSWFLLIYLAYCVVLWAQKGTTIGGIVCGLKVVRLDESKVDWTVAVVRGLSGFLSLAVVGLGFVWVAFDNEKQSWHDKIAGTIVVQVPKGVSLI